MKESDEFKKNKAKEKSTDPGKSSFLLPTLFIRVLQRVTSQDSVEKIKAVYQRLYSYLEELKILYPLQFGFRDKFSTALALISITECIRQSIVNDEFGNGVFIDLKKVFDTVNHTILRTKLHHYGMRGIVCDWFKSYLSQREQFVCVNGHNSISLLVTCGVPQGSILRPLLFLL